ncbi:1,4-dihydroxy-2-naphthoate polyprenyltransferase [Actinomyces timonensis]|uniref:1,4-dihydroxy-2-naphthoate polyprenyltransferase n=1 Tax=Actinomyces timonensis TaxID=1288391 RepID=UPI000308B52B|nr:1,4-dihydroxy-2-naphthoate polyprenyltransferase [Actinomyces timonensis]
MTATAHPGPAAAPSPGATNWAEVVRLRTLPAAVAPVLLGAGAATSLGTGSLLRTLLAAGVALALQIGCNLANDYSDGVRGTDDERSGPPRLTASGQVAPRSVKLAAFACFGIASALGLVLVVLTGQWWLIGVGAAAVAAAWFYTGGSRPYGYAGLGEVFVFVFFGLVATCGTAYVQGGAVPGWLWLAASGIGLIACSLLMVNNLRDIATDPAHGKMTLAVRLGDSRARTAYTIMVFLPILIAAGSLLWAHTASGGDQGVVVLIDLLAPVILISTFAWRAAAAVSAGATGRELIASLRNAGLYELVYGVVVGLAFLIVGT